MCLHAIIYENVTYTIYSKPPKNTWGDRSRSSIRIYKITNKIAVEWSYFSALPCKGLHMYRDRQRVVRATCGVAVPWSPQSRLFSSPEFFSFTQISKRRNVLTDCTVKLQWLCIVTWVARVNDSRCVLVYVHWQRYWYVPRLFNINNVYKVRSVHCTEHWSVGGDNSLENLSPRKH